MKRLVLTLILFWVPYIVLAQIYTDYDSLGASFNEGTGVCDLRAAKTTNIISGKKGGYISVGSNSIYSVIDYEEIDSVIATLQYAADHLLTEEVNDSDCTFVSNSGCRIRVGLRVGLGVRTRWAIVITTDILNSSSTTVIPAAKVKDLIEQLEKGKTIILEHLR